MSEIIDLGPVTAYAIAVKNGYVGTEQQWANEITSNGREIRSLRAAVGTPLNASSAAAMTDTAKIYVYTGTTTASLTNGYWYYYSENTNEWTEGGAYNNYALETDTTLSVSGMAADAKAVGDLREDIESAIVTSTINGIYNGLTISAEADGSLKIYGTATASRRLLCLNGQDLITISSTAFHKTLEAGHYLIETSITGYSDRGAWSYTYDTFANAVVLVTSNSPETAINFEHPVMLGFGFETNTDFGTIDSPTYVTFSAKQLTTIDAVARREAGKVQNAVLFSEQSLTDAQTEQARKNIDSVGNDALYKYNFYNAIALGNGTSGSLNGITYTKNSNGTWTIDGTATDTSFRNIINSSSAIPRYIIPGRKYKFSFNNGTVPIHLYIYKNGSVDSSVIYTEDFEITFPEDMDGLIF